MWLKCGDRQDVNEIKTNQNESRDYRSSKKIANGDGLRRKDSLAQLCLLVGVGEHVSQQNQRDGRRNDLTEGSCGTDGAGGEFWIVPLFEHGGQRHQTHGYHGCADDAGAGGHQHAHHHYRQPETTAQGTHQSGQAFEQKLGNARFFQDHAHEDEQGHCNQGLVGDDPEQPAW